MLAQLVQSIALTGRGSLVRVQYIPPNTLPTNKALLLLSRVLFHFFNCCFRDIFGFMSHIITTSASILPRLVFVPA